MSDLATLGLRIESQEAELADRRLDSFEQSATSAERATDSLAAAARGLGNALLPTLTSIDASVRELLELQRIQQGVVGSSTQQAAATQAVARETAEATAAVSFYSASFRTTQATMGGAAAAAKNWGAAVAQADSHVLAYRQHLDSLNDTLVQQDAHMAAYRGQIGGVGRGFRLTASEGLNLSRQIADIGVTSAMGMSPLLIAIQQGPQLFDIMQQAAIRSGSTIRAVMMATGAVIWTALAPLLPIIAAITAAGAVVFGGFALGARAAEKELGGVQKSLDLTDAEMKKLKDSGIDTGVTVGDVFRGLGTTIKEGFFDLFGEQVKAAGRVWNDFLDTAWAVYVNFAKVVTGSTFAIFGVIRDTWRMLPAVVGDAAVSAANAVIQATEWLANKMREFFNAMLRGAQMMSVINPALGFTRSIAEMDKFDFGEINNRWSGAMAELGRVAGKSWGENFSAGVAFADRQTEGLLKNVGASRDARVERGLGDRSAAGAGGTGRSDVEKLKEDLEQFARITLRPIDIRLPRVDETVPLRIIADELRLIDQLARDAATGMASAFGEAGEAMGDLLTIMTSYESRLAEIALAQKEGRLTEAQAIREQASAQIGSYGDMAAAARGFFREGSDGYKAMLAVEQVYRAFQFASAIQAMALGGQETAFTLGQNALRAASHGVVAVARAIASLPFPMNLVAGAATIAALAAIGVKIAGGGGSGSRGSSDEGADHSTDAVRSYTAQDAQAREQAASSIASKVEVRVTADREGLKAYVARTAQQEAFGVAAPMVAAAAAGTKRDVMQTLSDRQVGNRKISV